MTKSPQKVKIPASLNRVKGRSYWEDIEDAEIAKAKAAREAISAEQDALAKRYGKRERNFHSIDDICFAEIEGWRAIMYELLGIDDALLIENGFLFNNQKIAQTELLRRAVANRPPDDILSGKRGAPPRDKHRLAAMMVSVEAYVGSGLSVNEAVERASDKWGKTPRTFSNFYEAASLPRFGGRDLLRGYFHGISAKDVDRFVENYRSRDGELKTDKDFHKNLSLDKVIKFANARFGRWLGRDR